jgi:LmbE family N-acetylglucosaminyl deacetylase
VVAPHSAETLRRIVVVSPHLDDGVLSLGASIASWSRAGAVVELLTVLACDPDSGAATGGWDRRGGFATEGESARGRRDEDRRACAVIGARPIWLSFGSVDYERHGTEDEMRRAVAAAVDGAGVVLLPGFPLSHPDHAWLVRELATALGGRATALYAEQPYTRRAGADPTIPDWVADAYGERRFERVPAGPRDRLAKWRGIRCYRSQLPLLGMHRSPSRGPLGSAFAPEWVAWGGD